MIEKVKTDKIITSEQLFKLKKASSQTAYLTFTLANVQYGMNVHNINGIIESPALIYSSHMSPPVVGLQHYNKNYIPIMDFAGYRSNPALSKILILSTSFFRNDKIFGLLIDQINEIHYATQKDFIKNNYPFNNLLPSYFYINNRLNRINLLDVADLANQLDW